MKLGDPVLVVDPNRSVKAHIKGETSKSWVVRAYGADIKVPKTCKDSNFYFKSKTGFGLTIWLDLKEYEKRQWMDANRYRIAGTVQRCADYEKLRAIAEDPRWL